MIEIVQSPIDIQEVLASVQDPAAGGIDLFIGTTRNQSNGREVVSLEYEAYTPMALRLMQQLAGEALAGWDVARVSIVHRVGRVGIGEASIVIAVSAPHRGAAFAACRHLIDRLKKIVPIWKKEHFADGQVWVGLEGTEKE